MPRTKPYPPLSIDPADPDLWGASIFEIFDELYSQIDTNIGTVQNIKSTQGASGISTDNANGPFQAAYTAVKATRQPHPTGSDYIATQTIEIPPGNYLITQLKGMLGLETQVDKTLGLRVRGAGTGVTNIIFSPLADGALVYNDFWLNIIFEGISFITTWSGATWMQSYTTHNAQKYVFWDVSWTGPWKYIFDLQGTNNNSEFAFYSCSTSGMLDSGSFLFIGASGSDQFLNYWFYAFKHWSTGASIIDAAKGGHFHFDGLDVSAYGVTLAATQNLFNLRGNTHSAGVCSLTVKAMRVEAKNAFCGLLFSEWGTGNVTIECDWSSQVGGYTYGDILDLKFANVGGPIYNIHDSNLAGGIKVTYGSSTYQFAPRVLIERTIWHQKLTPSETITWVETGVSPNLTRPTVKFVDCKSDYNDYSSADGCAIWDDVTYSNRQPVMSLRKKIVKIGSLLGGVKDANTAPKVALPVGAIITGLTVLCPAGATAEADGGSWTVSTTETIPTVIVTATVAGALSAGYNVSQQLAVPYLCSARNTATITLTSSGVTTNTYSQLILLEGYW